MSYSVAIEVDRSGEEARPFGAFFLFIRWRRLGTQGVEGHLESPFLAWGTTAVEAKAALGATTLEKVKEILDGLIQANQPAPQRKWWDVMRDEGE